MNLLMENGKTHIDDMFSKKLVNHEETPPPELWDHIAHGLDQRKKRNLLPFILAAASVSVVLALSFSIYFFKDNASQNNIADEDQSTSFLEMKDIAVTSDDETSEGLRESDIPSDMSPTGGQQSVIAGADQNVPDHETLNKQYSPGKDDKIASVKSDSVYDKDLMAMNDDKQKSISPLARIFPKYVMRNSLHEIESILSGKQEEENNIKQYPDAVDDYIEGINDQKSSKWLVGGNVSPLYSYRRIASNEMDMASVNVFEESEEPIIAYSGGINVSYELMDRLTIQTGFYYTKMGQSVDEIYQREIFSEYKFKDQALNYFAINSSQGEFSSDWSNASNRGEESLDQSIILNNIPIGGNQQYVLVNGELTQSFEYLEIPFKFKYRVIDRRTGINIIAGVSTNFLVGNKAILELEGVKENIGYTSGIRSINYSSSIGVGFNHELFDNVLFNLEPFFKYYINSINDPSLIDSHPYALGIYTGILYRF